MEPLEVAKRINHKINELEKLKTELPSYAQKKAVSMVAYEKALATESLALCINNPVSLVDKLARGKCADLKGDMDLAESMYKNCLKIIDITEAQLNGYQSINRYLSEV
jgi:hypothetical protein